MAAVGAPPSLMWFRDTPETAGHSSRKPAVKIPLQSTSNLTAFFFFFFLLRAGLPGPSSTSAIVASVRPWIGFPLFRRKTKALSAAARGRES